MNPLNPIVHIVAVSALAFGMAAQAQTIPVTKQEAVPVKVGDTWNYNFKSQLEATRNEQLQISVASATAERWTAKHVGTVSGESSSERGHDWKVFKGNFGGVAVEYKPYALDYGFPLEVGKTFKSEASFLNAQNDTITQKYEGKVVGLEKITVGSVQLDTWVIESSGWWQAGRFSGRLNSKVWYSPAARAFVKTETRRWRSNSQLDSFVSTELTSYKLAD